MPAYLWITSAAAVAFILWIAFGRRWLHSLWYSWRDAAHAYAQFEADYPEAPEFIGSMIAAEEHHTWPEWLAAPTVDPEPWREQITAELAPEALDPPPLSRDLSGDLDAIPSHRIAEPGKREIVRHDAGGWNSGPCLPLDPGPGDSSLASDPPGPDQTEFGGGQGYELHERLTDDYLNRYQWHDSHRPGLGPRACAVLDRYERRVGARRMALA